MFFRTLFAFISLTLVLIGSSFANDTLSELELSPVVVTATRSPHYLNEIAQSVSIIDRADIEAAPADSLADLLEYVSGVDVRQRSSHGVQADVSIRGGSHEQTLVLLNGISMSNPQVGHHNMDIPVSLNDIERIEIVKGPGARVYGANAMAGVINVITRKGQVPSVAAQIKAGDYDSLASDFQAHFLTGGWHNNLSASQSYSSGFDNDEPTGFNTKTANYQGRGQFGKQEIELGTAYTHKKFGASRFYFDAPDQNEETKTLVSYVAANLQSGAINWRPHVSWIHHDDRYRYKYGSNWYQNETDTDKYSFQITGNTSLSWGDLAFGVTTEREEINSSNLGEHHRNNINLSLNYTLALTEALSISPGVSAAHYSDWGWQYWPGIEANYRFNNNLHWFASVAKSFRIPTYLEMYYNTPSNIGDPNLDAEEAWTWESGLRWQKKRISANLSIFLRDSSDLIDWSRKSSSDAWMVRNVTDSTTSGIEVGVDIKQPLAALPVIGRVSLGYTYLDQDIDSAGLESKYSLNNLRHQLHGALYLDWAPRISHVIKARLEERMMGDSSFVVDSKLSYQASEMISLSVEASNLLDEEYIESGDAPMPGRWIMVGLSMQHDFI